LGKNVSIFLTLILIVAGFNMVSILLIMIMERIQMIGILKALGATNWQIRMIFIYKGLLLITKGMGIGNFVGLGFCTIQYYFKVIPLDPENYYMSSVPIDWNWTIILLMNLLTFTVISLVLLLPTFIITRVKPVTAIRFD
jgi:lipoprotein-releasing system permease protein